MQQLFTYQHLIRREVLFKVSPLGKQVLLLTGFAFQLWEVGSRLETGQGLNKILLMEIPVQKEAQRWIVAALWKDAQLTLKLRLHRYEGFKNVKSQRKSVSGRRKRKCKGAL